MGHPNGATNRDPQLEVPIMAKDFLGLEEGHNVPGLFEKELHVDGCIEIYKNVERGETSQLRIHKDGKTMEEKDVKKGEVTSSGKKLLTSKVERQSASCRRE